MDERQAQIREGAGLEESKLNVEFIEWLRRWSTPLMMVAAITAAGYFLYQRYERGQLAKVDRAFAELDSARSTANPESLKAVATEYEGVRAVPVLARLAAADAYLQAARTGVKPGAALKQDGTVAPEDLLAEKDRDATLGEAQALYQQVLDKTQGDEREALHAIGAAFGLAAVAESRGQLDQAKQQYDRVVALADKGGYGAQGEIAKKRASDLPSNPDASRLYVKAELPTPPMPPPPPAPPGASGPTGIGGNIPGMTFTPNFAAPTGSAEPAPAAPTAPATPPAPTSPPK